MALFLRVQPPKTKNTCRPIFWCRIFLSLRLPLFSRFAGGLYAWCQGRVVQRHQSCSTKDGVATLQGVPSGRRCHRGNPHSVTVSLGCCWGGHFLHLGLESENNHMSVYGCFNWMMNQTFTWEMLVSPNIHLKLGVEGSTSFLWFCREVQMILGTIATLPQID